MIPGSTTGSQMVLATCGIRGPRSLPRITPHPVATPSQASQVSHTDDWTAVADASLAETANSMVVAQGGNSITFSGVSTVTLTTEIVVFGVHQSSSYVC